MEAPGILLLWGIVDGGAEFLILHPTFLNCPQISRPIHNLKLESPKSSNQLSNNQKMIKMTPDLTQIIHIQSN
jgi:hypothetical protein